MDIKSQRGRVRAYVDTALRTWATTGFDERRGIFVEALDFNGTPLVDLPRRGRVQARQIYVYALAHRYGFDQGDAYLSLAQASEAAEKIYRHDGGGWIFSADPSGAPAGSDCFAYEQSFRIMSLAALFRATGIETFAEQADRSWQWIETLRDPVHGGFRLGEPDRAAPREQNPHMHLFEACLEARDTAAVWIDRANEIYKLALRKFVSPEGALIEFFTDDWLPDTEKGADIQPGHHFEWVWLLTRYSSASSETQRAIEQLYRSGAQWGLDPSGLGLDEVRPGGLVVRGTKRLWVQCEVLKGHLALYETTSRQQYLDAALRTLELMFAHYLIEKSGVWYDRIDENDRNISANAPASSFYHVLIALNEFLRLSAGV